MKYSLGLDIGTTSVGWAVINEEIKRIEDLGVRIFDTPENPKDGTSLATPRRTKRSMRRRLGRRRQRLNYLKNFFINNNLLDKNQVEAILDPTLKPQINPYEARQKAIEQTVSNEELFAALYAIAKRRGYKSNRKKIEESDKESGRILAAIKHNKEYLSKYKTIGSVLYSDENFSAHKRNKTDSYQNSFIREDFEEEVRLILKTQKWPEEQIEKLFHDPAQKWGGIFDQRPFMTEELIAKMRGNCPLEKDEKRAWKASWTFELFRLAQDLSHLEYNQGTKLTSEQIANVIEVAKQTQSVKYKKVREVLGFKDDPNFKFDYIRGKKEKSYEEEEKHEFCNLKYYHAIKKAVTTDDFAYLESHTDDFDLIGYILTTNKDDKNIEEALKKLPLSAPSIDKLMGLNFTGFAHLSIKALKKLTPHLLNGATYDKAVEAEYPGKFAEKLSGTKNELPPLTEEQQNQITNPVAKRAINQTRKVVNAIIKKYGAPYQIKIECANELAKTFRDRMEIKKRQDENNAANNARVEKLKELGITNPTGQQIVKYKLYEEQLCKCQYCGKAFGPEIFHDDKLTEVDHIIPFSRCGNDGLANKALVCATCNQEKKNATPFEKWGSDTERWKTICDLAQGTNINFKKRDRILAEKLPKEEWNKRALNDTRYVMKFMSQYIKRNLKFNQDYKANQRVILPTGFITSYLRKMYHLGHKDRELNNCHHAVDACVIATTSQGQIQKIAKWNKYKELGAKYSAEIKYFDEDNNPVIVTKKEYEELTNELLPWENFDKEVIIRSGMSYNESAIENLDDFRDKFRDFKTYDEDFLNKIHPLFVSRMPKRSAKGSAHKDTIRSPKKTDDDRRLTREPIQNITLEKLENSILIESDKALYNQIKRLLEEKGTEALKEPIYKNNKKVDKNGKPLSPVTSIKVYSREPSGILINKGTQFVNNGDTVCLNIYRRKSINGEYKFFAAPVYVHSVRARKIEILPTPKGRTKEEKADLDTIRENRKIYATKENGFEKLFSIFPNDYVRFTHSDKIVEGYYVKYGIGNGNICLMTHNQANKDIFINCHLGNIKNELMNISILGDNYIPSKPEKE